MPIFELGIISVSSSIILNNNSLFLLNISDKLIKFVFILHSQVTFFVIISYSLYMQLLSHKDKLLLNSFFLSSNTLSSTHSVKDGKHLSL